MASEDAIYHRLRKEIDERMPIGLPLSKSGLEIKMLKLLFSSQEANIAVHLSALPEKLEKIHSRISKYGISLSIDELEEILDDMVKRGIIMGSWLLSKDPYKKLYSLAHFAVGIYEFQVDKQSKELAEMAEAYMKEAFYKEFHKKKVPTQIRTIPIGESITPEHHVASYDSVLQLLEKKEGPFTLVNCVCRQSHDLIEDTCKLSNTRRCCVMFHDKDKFAYGVEDVEEVSKERLLEYIKVWQKAGFVLQPENAQDPIFMCVCCGCCCGVLQSAKQFPKPAEFYSSNYYAHSNSELCNGCQVCMKRCQMEAVNIVNEKAVVNLDRCIGCGNCVPTCGMKAMKLLKKDQIIVPPKSHQALYAKIMMKKKGTVGSLALVGKAILGKKV